MWMYDFTAEVHLLVCIHYIWKSISCFGRFSFVETKSL